MDLHPVSARKHDTAKWSINKKMRRQHFEYEKMGEKEAKRQINSFYCMPLLKSNDWLQLLYRNILSQIN